MKDNDEIYIDENSLEYIKTQKSRDRFISSLIGASIIIGWSAFIGSIVGAVSLGYFLGSLLN